MKGLEWGDEQSVVFALVVLALLIGFLVHESWRRARLAELRERGPLIRSLLGPDAQMRLIRATCVVLAAGLLVAGLCRPQYGTRETEVKNLGIDVAIALDASKSMKVTDVVPDRLTAAQVEIHKLLDKLSGGRVALVPFAGLAFIQTPMTSDFHVVSTYLDELRVEDMPLGGTAIGRAIIEGIRALIPASELEGSIAEEEASTRPSDPLKEAEAQPEVAELSGSKHKAIILFTDGEDHVGEPMKAAELAKKLGIRVYPVGVGTVSAQPVPMIDVNGRVSGYVKKKDGRTPEFSDLNEVLLEDIAKLTGGRYMHLGTAGLADQLIGAVDELEKAEYTHTFSQLGADRFQWVAIPALVLLILEALLATTRWRRRRYA